MVRRENGIYIIEDSEEERENKLRVMKMLELTEEEERQYIRYFIDNPTYTGGLWINRSASGAIRIGCEHYHVRYFDGDDFEYWYDMDKENAEKFFAALKKEHPEKETAEEQAIEEFSIELLDNDLREFCKKYGIEFIYGSWRS